MGLPVDVIGRTTAPRTATIDPERAKRYAAATNDDNPAYESGKLAPPVFGVVPTWESVGELVAGIIPPESLMFIVHGEQDMHFHQPLVPGHTLVTRAEAHSIRVGGSGTRLTARITSDDESGERVLEQFNTVFIRGMSDGESAGPDKPAHDLPDDVRAATAGEHSIHVDDDQTFRYREASGDEMPIHLDDAFAKSVGLPGIIAHGLCTMAMCSQAVIQTVAGGDPERLKRLAVRFAANVFPGNDVVVSIYDGGSGDGRARYPFEAESGGAVVIKNGLAEIL